MFRPKVLEEKLEVLLRDEGLLQLSLHHFHLLGCFLQCDLLSLTKCSLRCSILRFSALQIKKSALAATAKLYCIDIPHYVQA